MVAAVDPTVRDLLVTIQHKDCDDDDEKGQFSNAYFLTWPLRTEILAISKEVTLEDILSFYPLLARKKYARLSNCYQLHGILFNAMPIYVFYRWTSNQSSTSDVRKSWNTT